MQTFRSIIAGLFVLLLLMVGVLTWNEFGSPRSLLNPMHTQYPAHGEYKRCEPSILRSTKSAVTELQILGPSNTWPLSRFLCSLASERYALVDFTKHGAVFTHYKLQLENTRGVGLTINLQELEIRQGSHALVGVQISDPLTTRSLDILAWQQLVQQLVDTNVKPTRSSR